MSTEPEAEAEPESAPAAARAPREDGVTLAYRRLRSDVLSGHLRPGQVLSQVKLAAELGVGRGPLREALRHLMTEGLVTGDFNRQMRVSDLDLDDFDQIYALRFALEPVGVAATVPDLDDVGRRQLSHHVEAMDDAIDEADMEAFRTHHRAFHLGLTANAGARIRGVLADLWDHSERYRLSYLHTDAPQDWADTRSRLCLSQTEHRDILAAALAGDSDGCSGVLIAHLHRTLDVVFAEASHVPRVRVARQALGLHRPEVSRPVTTA